MIDGLDKPDAPHLKQVVQIFAALGEPLHHAEHQPQVAFHHLFPGCRITGVGAGQQFPLFGFGQHRQLCSVHAAQLHFVVHPNAPRSVLIFTGSMALRAKHYAREKLGAVIRFPIVLLRYG